MNTGNVIGLIALSTLGTIAWLVLSNAQQMRRIRRMARKQRQSTMLWHKAHAEMVRPKPAPYWWQFWK
jgi:hypothetical protein